DLRLDPPWSEGSLTRAERLRSAALLQMEEADLLARAGEGARARTLAAELERWAPAGVLDRRGRDPAALVLALRERFGWHPYLPERPAEPYPFDVWREDEAATSRDETRSIEFLALNGPGAARLAEEYVVLVRGLTVEVWSLAERRRVARLP
ncbi:MAG: hypothetical protein P1V36_18195, partial [Planctomycetota bacterium]|nr:hypothetical protein [Planctomycetota bacterium]